ncbi:MAG: TetR/AcrR family transcriptional regulator [Bacteriovoracaceae bacterium]|nr:TetR/AcrR family transcriptional regulator [Bacteriovoracaceae bacterium]
MNSRAESTERTRQSVLDAAAECFTTSAYDCVSLKDIAKLAKVGLQTVVRIGESKEKLFTAGAERAFFSIIERTKDIPDDDFVEGLEFLMDLYESWGDRMLRILSQEDRIPAIKVFAELNRSAQKHRIETLFSSQLSRLNEVDKERKVISLMSVSGSHSWHVLRRVHGLSKEQTTLAIKEMVEKIIS